MIIENIDDVHNLHIGISLMDAKLVAAVLNTVTREGLDSAIADLAKDNLKISVLELGSVIQQALMSIRPYTSQIRLSTGFEAYEGQQAVVH